MPALSFQEMWLRKLLDGTKQQTTRGRTDRIKVGDVCHIYNQQRRRITDKQTLSPTRVGAAMIFQMIEDEGRYPQPECDKSFGYSIDPYYAHFLGKVVITEVYDMRHPIGRFPIGLEEWALKDGFDTYLQADDWFTKRYGSHWLYQNWTVIQWDGWLERYFLAEGEAI
jgi:hypothetical protein